MLEFLGPYQYVVAMALISVIAVYGTYLMLRAGIFAVPQPGFMAIGAYSGSLFTVHVTDNWLLGLLAGAAFAAVVGGVLGLAMMRLNGIYLAIASIGFNEIVRIVARNLSITGGPAGLFGIEPFLADWQLVVVLVIVVAIFVRLPFTTFGRALDVMREDTLVAAHQGISLTRTRLTLFTISGAVAGLAGSMSAHYSGFIDPSQFDFNLLVDLMATAVIGGTLNGIGPILGGLVVYGLPEYVAPLGPYRHIVSGALIVVVVAFAPGGIAGTLERWGRLASTAWRGRGQPVGVAGGAAIEVGPGPTRPARSPGGVLLSVRGATMSFGGVVALSDVSFDIAAGEILGVIGPNGSGKTTLLNVLSGAYRADAVALTLDGRDISHLAGSPDRVVRAGIARTFQGIRLIPHMSVVENIAVGSRWLRPGRFLPELLGLPTQSRRRARQRQQAAEVMRELDLAGIIGADVSGLPYGPQRRVEIARAVMSEPKVILLDEPTAGMTAGETHEIFDLMSKLASTGMAVVVVEHDVASMSRYCDRVIVLDAGRVLAQGRPDEVISDERVVEAYVGRRAA